MPARTLGEDLVEGMRDAVILVDDQFRVRWLNRSLEQQWNVERDQVIGRVLWDVFPHAVGTPQYHAITRAMRTREPTHIEAYSKPWRTWIEVNVRPSGTGLVIQIHDITARKRTETLLRGERKALELAMHDAPLSETLEVLVRTLEDCVDDGSMASILVVRDGKLYCGAAPRLPPAYNTAIEGLVIGPSSGSCGTAAFTGELVIAKDLRNDPRWAEYKALADEHHLGSCWSWPIRSRSGKVLATFALYTHEPSEGPSIDQLEIVKLLSTTAGLVVERHTEVEAKATATRELAAAHTAAERADRAKDEKASRSSASRVPRRVLVVDDNVDIADMMAEVLGDAGHDVRVANDGAGALSVLDGFSPEAVLLDIGLPVMDGFEVARELRSRGTDAFLVAITGYGQQADRDRSKDAGFDAHLLKPVKVDAVLQLLDRLAE